MNGDARRRKGLGGCVIGLLAIIAALVAEELYSANIGLHTGV